MKPTIQDARALAESCMEAVGRARDEAEIIADPLIDCELRGLQFGGLPCALSIIERLRNTTTLRRSISIECEALFSASINDGDQVGCLVGDRAIGLAIDKAKATGLAVVGAPALSPASRARRRGPSRC